MVGARTISASIVLSGYAHGMPCNKNDRCDLDELGDLEQLHIGDHPVRPFGYSRSTASQGGRVGLLSFRRKPHAATLSDELRHLEQRARVGRTALGEPFSRALLAKESGVSEGTLAAWLDRGRTPRDGGKLQDVVRVLSAWAGPGTPSSARWTELWAAARKDSAARKNGSTAESEKGKHRAKRVLAWIGTAVALTLVSGFFTPVGGDLLHLITSHVAHSAKPAAAREDLEAHASWCCRFTSIIANTGFYWTGSVARLSAALEDSNSSNLGSAYAPAGLGVIEIPLQTSGTESIDVEPPKVIVRSRTANPTRGIVAILPRGGQGGGAPAQFEADVDDNAAVTVPFGSTGSQPSSFQYVSSSSPETITLYVADSKYDCTFDIRLTWLAQGHTHTELLTNGGQHFRMFGSAGLPWYEGDPRLGGKLSRVSGHPFSYYAPGSV